MRPDELMARCAASGIDLILTFQQTVPEGEERALRNYDGPIPKQTRVIKQPEWTAEDAAGACQNLDWRYYAAFAFRFAGDQSQRPRLRKALLRKAQRLARQDNWKLVRQCANCAGTGIVHEIVKDQKTGKAIRDESGEWKTRKDVCPICKSFGKVSVTIKHEDGRIFEEYTRGAGHVVVLDQLVDLAIFEEWLTVHYVTGLVQLAKDRCWAGLIGIDQGDWERTVQKQYRAIQCVIDDWCGSAYSHIARRMHDDEEDVA